MLRAVHNLGREVSRMRRRAADFKSLARFAADSFLFRLMRLVRLPRQNRVRQIKLQDGIRLTYRLNRGDIQSIREVWLEECYKLPSATRPKTIIDLGANIGLTSVWLARRYDSTRIIAVEPSPTNARIAQMNFAANNIPARLIEAAVGPTDGVTLFEDSDESNLGHVGDGGREVCMVSMTTLLREIPAGAMVDLLKIDIEGGEQALLTSGELSWLDRVREIIVEFHPETVEYPKLVSILQAAGFRYIPAGTAHPGSMDYFVRSG